METPRLLKDANGEPYIQLGMNVLRLERDDIDGPFLELAREELRETPENVEKGLADLRKLIEEEVGLHLPVEDSEFLVKFLRPCKFHADSAFKIIKKFYKFKAKHTKYYANLTPKEVVKVYMDEVVYFLPKRCPTGTRLMVLNVGCNWNPKEVSLTQLFKALLLALEIAMGEPRTQVGGVHIIVDMGGFSMKHVIQFSPGFAKTLLTMIQECLPIRLEGIHIINEPSVFGLVYSIFKPFIGDKLNKRVFFHQDNWESLQKMIPADCLPPEWGGCIQSPPCPGQLLNEVLHHYEDEYELLGTYGYTMDKVELA